MFYKTLIISFLLSLNLYLLSGQPIHYDYDGSGNRIKRYIVLGKGNSSDEKSTKEFEEIQKTEKTEEYKEVLGELSIKIYPNPTKGQLTVVVSGLAPDEPVDYQLLSQAGILLQTARKNALQFTVELDRYPSGMYILRLLIQGKISQWKILKE